MTQEDGEKKNEESQDSAHEVASVDDSSSGSSTSWTTKTSDTTSSSEDVKAEAKPKAKSSAKRKAKSKTAAKKVKEEKAEDEEDKGEDVEEAAREAAALAELDGVRMKPYWDYCHGLNPDLTIQEALCQEMVSSEKHNKTKTLPLPTNDDSLIAFILEAKQPRKRKGDKKATAEPGLEEGLEREVKREDGQPLKRIRQKTSSFLDKKLSFAKYYAIPIMATIIQP